MLVLEKLKVSDLLIPFMIYRIDGYSIINHEQVIETQYTIPKNGTDHETPGSL